MTRRKSYTKQDKGDRAKQRQSKQKTREQKPTRSSGALIWIIIFIGGMLWAFN